MSKTSTCCSCAALNGQASRCSMQHRSTPKAETRVVLFTPEGEEKRIGSFMPFSYDINTLAANCATVAWTFEGKAQKV